jgi:NADH-quinone oxidoreductase subunit F
MSFFGEHPNLTCKENDLVVVVGTLPSRGDDALAETIETCVENEAKLVYLFTMEDAKLTPLSTFFSRYEVGSEEGVLALLAKSFLSNAAMPSAYRDYFDALDEGYVSAESNIGEEEIEEIQALYEDAKNVVLVLGGDIVRHPRFDNIARLAGLLAQYGKVALVWTANDEKSVENAYKNPLEEIEAIASFDGVVVYDCPARSTEEEALLIGSPQFQTAARVQHNDTINLTLNQAVYPRTFVRDDSLKGVIALMPGAKEREVYPYHVAKIVKAEQ